MFRHAHFCKLWDPLAIRRVSGVILSMTATHSMCVATKTQQNKREAAPFLGAHIKAKLNILARRIFIDNMMR